MRRRKIAADEQRLTPPGRQALVLQRQLHRDQLAALLQAVGIRRVTRHVVEVGGDRRLHRLQQSVGHVRPSAARIPRNGTGFTRLTIRLFRVS
jgi:hypothetical protein